MSGEAEFEPFQKIARISRHVVEAARVLFKKTIKGDEKPKGSMEAG